MDGSVRDLPRCQGVKADGSPCERIVGARQQWCYSHDPAKAEERRATASKAAKSKPLAEVAEIKQEIRTIMREIRDKELDRGDGAVLLQGAGMFLKAVATGLKVQEQQELVERLEEVEAMLDSQRSGANRYGA